MAKQGKGKSTVGGDEVCPEGTPPNIVIDVQAIADAIANIENLSVAFDPTKWLATPYCDEAGEPKGVHFVCLLVDGDGLVEGEPVSSEYFVPAGGGDPVPGGPPADCRPCGPMFTFDDDGNLCVSMVQKPGEVFDVAVTNFPSPTLTSESKVCGPDGAMGTCWKVLYLPPLDANGEPIGACQKVALASGLMTVVCDPEAPPSGDPVPLTYYCLPTGEGGADQVVDALPEGWGPCEDEPEPKLLCREIVTWQNWGDNHPNPDVPPGPAVRPGVSYDIVDCWSDGSVSNAVMAAAPAGDWGATNDNLAAAHKVGCPSANWIGPSGDPADNNPRGADGDQSTPYGAYSHAIVCAGAKVLLKSTAYPLDANGDRRKDKKGNDIAISLATGVIETKRRVWLCKVKGGGVVYEDDDGNPVVPTEFELKCMFPCGASPEIPKPLAPTCQTSTPITVCEAMPGDFDDDGNQADPTLVTADLFLSFITCGSAVRAFAYTLDADGNPIEHTLGEGNYYGNCDDLSPIDPPPPPECPAGSKFDTCVQWSQIGTPIDNSLFENTPNDAVNLPAGVAFDLTHTRADGSTEVFSYDGTGSYFFKWRAWLIGLGCDVPIVCANWPNCPEDGSRAVPWGLDLPQDEMFALGFFVMCCSTESPFVKVEVTASAVAGWVGAFKDLTNYDGPVQTAWMASNCEGVFLKDCDGVQIADPGCKLEPCEVTVATALDEAVTKCESCEGASTTVMWTDPDDETDQSFGIGQVAGPPPADQGIKFDTSSEDLPAGLRAVHDEIRRCIAAGGTANFTISDSEGGVVELNVDTDLSTVNNGVTQYVYTGSDLPDVDPAGGKIRVFAATCTAGEGECGCAIRTTLCDEDIEALTPDLVNSPCEIEAAAGTCEPVVERFDSSNVGSDTAVVNPDTGVWSITPSQTNANTPMNNLLEKLNQGCVLAAVFVEETDVSASSGWIVVPAAAVTGTAAGYRIDPAVVADFGACDPAAALAAFAAGSAGMTITNGGAFQPGPLVPAELNNLVFDIPSDGTANGRCLVLNETPGELPEPSHLPVTDACAYEKLCEISEKLDADPVPVECPPAAGETCLTLTPNAVEAFSGDGFDPNGGTFISENNWLAFPVHHNTQPAIDAAAPATPKTGTIQYRFGGLSMVPECATLTKLKVTIWWQALADDGSDDDGESTWAIGSEASGIFDGTSTVSSGSYLADYDPFVASGGGFGGTPATNNWAGGLFGSGPTDRGVGTGMQTVCLEADASTVTPADLADLLLVFWMQRWGTDAKPFEFILHAITLDVGWTEEDCPPTEVDGVMALAPKTITALAAAFAAAMKPAAPTAAPVCDPTVTVVE